jgi:hypothetical protein
MQHRQRRRIGALTTAFIVSQLFAGGHHMPRELHWQPQVGRKTCAAGNFCEAVRSNKDVHCFGENVMRTALKQHQVRTKRPAKKGVTPRLPHERDESEDSQESGELREDMKQAYEDLQEGQVDTDLRNTGGVDEAVSDRPGKSPDKVVKKSF